MNIPVQLKPSLLDTKMMRCPEKAGFIYIYFPSDKDIVINDGIK